MRSAEKVLDSYSHRWRRHLNEGLIVAGSAMLVAWVIRLLNPDEFLHFYIAVFVCWGLFASAGYRTLRKRDKLHEQLEWLLVRGAVSRTDLAHRGLVDVFIRSVLFSFAWMGAWWLVRDKEALAHLPLPLPRDMVWSGLLGLG